MAPDLVARAPLSPAHLDAYKHRGFVDVGRLFTEDEMEFISAGYDRRVHASNAPPGGEGRPDNLVNLHAPPISDSWVLELAAHPRVTAIAAQLLGSAAVRIFATRLLCKESARADGGGDGPGGGAVPCHMDAHYWNLSPLKVVSVWLALDDTDSENGALEVLPLDKMPIPRLASTADTPAAGPLLSLTQPEGGLRIGTTAKGSASTPLLKRAFTVGIDPGQMESLRDRVHTLTLPRGSASFHDVMLPHGSQPNRSTTRRRAAWICRYVAAETYIVPVSAEGQELMQCGPWPMGDSFELCLVRDGTALNPPPGWTGRRTDGGSSVRRAKL